MVQVAALWMAHQIKYKNHIYQLITKQTPQTAPSFIKNFLFFIDFILKVLIGCPINTFKAASHA